LAGEFVAYLEEGAGDALQMPPWLAELAHYVYHPRRLSDDIYPG
jgi:hypothetical protein